MTDATRWQLVSYFVREQERTHREDNREPDGIDWAALLNFIRDLERVP